YVGTKELASFLIVTPQGNILMNSDYETSVPVIKKSVEDLGFKFSDIKVLIAGHAHPDHVGGDQAVKDLTGAKVVVGRVDAPGTREFKSNGKEHPIDQLIDDGETFTFGGFSMTAHIMPGHTQGCLAWTFDLKENGKTYHTLVECSLNSRALAQYPGMVDEFRATFKKARTLPADVWVSSHASFYNMAAKYAKLQARGPNDPNPFIDPQGYLAHVDEFEKNFEAAIAAPPAGARGGGKGKGGPPPAPAK
ncbi:MAG: MBL fold metallo-hydrolase, partial [Acidobacteriota bacterium]